MSRKCFKFVCVVLAAAAFAAIAGVGRAETVLLQDTFNNVTDADTYGVADGYGVNKELDQTYRQTGTYKNTTYATSSTDGWAQVNNPGLGAGRFAAAHSNWISPNHNFNGADAAGGLKISFDFLPPDVTTSTLALVVGTDSAGAGGTTLPNPGLGVIFIRAYPGYDFDGDVHCYANYPDNPEYSAHYTDTPGVWHNVTLLFTDTVDSNPFSGSGNLRVRGFVDSSTTPFMTMNLTTDFANNYITLLSGIGGTYSLYDNLTVSQVPEPTAATLLVTGLIGLLAYAWRKRK